jgi:hypothetical protein
MKRSLLTFALALTVAALGAQERHESIDALPADVLLARAADYVRRFERSMSTAVLEERYVQIIKRWSAPPKTPDSPRLAWAEDLSALRPDVRVLQRRQTKSDVLLVQLPDRSWTAFRDTFEVNGRLQRNRDNRLRDLFLEQTDDSRRQLRRINQASADWNLGDFYREINLPTTGLLLLLQSNQRRIAYQAGAVDPAAGCRTFSFVEKARPTIVRSLRDRDVPLTGQVCIGATGTVYMTRLDLDSRYTTRGAIEVSYQPHERLDVLVPSRMWEWYVIPEEKFDWPVYVEGLATYSNLRQFSVKTSETVK